MMEETWAKVAVHLAKGAPAMDAGDFLNHFSMLLTPFFNY